MNGRRADLAYPFAIDRASGEAARAASYDAHVAQMLKQLLLTAPGERVNRPELGCGLRRLLFAPSGEGTAATARILVLQAIEKYLKGIIVARDVQAEAKDDGRLEVTVVYQVVETRSEHRLGVQVGATGPAGGLP